MRSFDEILSSYSQVDLLEYEFVVDSHVWLSLLGYPKSGSDPKAGRYKIFLSKPRAIVFHRINAPTPKLVKAELEVASGSTAVFLEFADDASIRVKCDEVLWVEASHG